MKKLSLFAIIGLTTAFSASAQTFQWTTPQTVEANLVQNTTVQFPLYQEAIGTDTVTLGIEIIYNDIPASWDGMVCIYGSCLGIIPPVGITAEMTPINGTTEGMVRLTINPITGTEVAKLQVYVFDINFPNDGDTATFLLNATLGIETSTILESNLIVSPNPSSDVITIDSPTGLRHVSIINAAGKMVVEYNLNGVTNSVMNVRDYQAGVYIIRIEDINGSIVNRKLIKE